MEESVNQIESFVSSNLASSVENTEKLMSDEEGKTLFTLETKKVNNTAPLKINEELIDVTELAKRQLDALGHPRPKKKSIKPDIVLKKTTSTEEVKLNDMPIEIQVLSGTKTAPLSSIIVSNQEITDEIRKKVVKLSNYGSIEIPHDLILSETLSQPSSNAPKETNEMQLDGDLIDILEGRGDEEELFEIVDDSQERVVIVSKEDESDDLETMNYEIVTDETELAEKQTKMMEREIALRQIQSLPMRNSFSKKKLPQRQSPAATTSKTLVPNPRQLVDSIAAEWSEGANDSEDGTVSSTTTTLTFELENAEAEPQDSKIKILNMKILNTPYNLSDAKTTPKQAPARKTTRALPTVTKAEPPKILNINAPKIVQAQPKILNTLAPKSPAKSTTPDHAAKSSRLIKKKVIYDPSDASKVQTFAPLQTEKKLNLATLPTQLPSGITIKKITKASIANEKAIEPKIEVVPKEAVTVTRKTKKRSEIDKLMGDEGVANMIYSLERENNNSEVSETDVNSLTNQKTSLVLKGKAVKNAVSPSMATTQSGRPVRAKRENTPQKVETVPPPVASPRKLTGARKRKSDNNSWDYIQDESMIIRRHSNSSYSSSAPTSPRRMSLDQSNNADDETGSNASSNKKLKESDEPFEFTKPPLIKSPQVQDVLPPNFVKDLRGKITKVMQNKVTGKEQLPVKMSRKRAATPSTSKETSPKVRASDRKTNGNDFKELQLTRRDEIAHIVLTPTESSLSNVFSITLLNELKSLFNQLETDSTCRVVLVTASSRECFSNGLDVSGLQQNTIDKRKQAASDLATAMKTCLVTMAAFPKLLICGVDGTCSGLAVTMLPLFDVVFASETATFSIPHAKSGQIPEGLSLLKSSGKVQVNAISEMFYLGETLDVDEAKQYGLVTKVITDDFASGLMSYWKNIGGSEYSIQSIEATKSILNEDLLNNIEGDLIKETKILQQQWISAEFQEKLKNYMKNQEW
ncbi:unnamed protein product [Diamesa tonsa]